LSKLWTALPEANFRRSVGYQVSVVQIESRQDRRYPRPVGEPKEAGPRIYALAFHSPKIVDLRVIRQDDPQESVRPVPYARVGDTLVILGHSLSGEHSRVILGAVDATAQVTSLSDDRIDVVIPDDDGLQPGTHTVRLVRDVEMGEPPELHAGFQSNVAVFALVPQITGLDTGTPGALTIHGTRLFQEGTECLTLLGDEVVPAGDYTNRAADEIAFAIPGGLGSGDHALRIRVNGTESIDDVALSI
jgi:hypothetical protein